MVFGLLVTAVALSSLPSSRYLPIPFTRAATAISVALPQGWAFFTRDPSDENDAGYVRRDGEWVPIVDALSPADSVGVSRQARAIDAEVAALARAAGSKHVACAAGADVQLCAESAPRIHRRFEAAAPLCEPVLVRSVKPVPFAYGTRVASMSSTVVVVDAVCGS